MLIFLKEINTFFSCLSRFIRNFFGQIYFSGQLHIFSYLLLGNISCKLFSFINQPEKNQEIFTLKIIYFSLPYFLTGQKVGKKPLANLNSLLFMSTKRSFVAQTVNSPKLTYFFPVNILLNQYQYLHFYSKPTGKIFPI